MVEKNSKIPFPQANDIYKIIQILKIENEIDLKDNSVLVDMLKITLRQVSYYLSACIFLGLIDKNRMFTTKGIDIREKSNSYFEMLLCSTIVSKPVFGEVFFNYFFNGVFLSSEEIAQLILLNYEVDSIEVANRRASTVKKWVEWIISKSYKVEY